VFKGTPILCIASASPCGRPLTLALGFMNIDDLVAVIESTSKDKEVHDLAQLIHSWKADDATASELSTKVERYIGHVWFKSDAIHEQIFSAWQAFKGEAILNIAGMTMNERLYLFGLFNRFDAATEHEQGVIYAKLNAQR
jgi:hypothetical protein